MTLKEFERALDAAAAPYVEKIKALVPCKRVTLVPGELRIQTDPEGHYHDVSISFGNKFFGEPGFRYEILIAGYRAFDPSEDTAIRSYYRVAAILLDDAVAGKVRMLLKTFHAKTEALHEEFKKSNAK